MRIQLLLAFVSAVTMGVQAAHVAHLRTGTINILQLKQNQNQLQRKLLASGAHHEHHSHPTWGCLSDMSMHMVSLSPAAQSHEAQLQLADGLEAHGGAITSFLPPFTLVVLAGQEAAQWLDKQPGVVRVLYPADHKIAPEFNTLLQRLALGTAETGTQPVTARPSTAHSTGSRRSAPGGTTSLSQTVAIPRQSAGNTSQGNRLSSRGAFNQPFIGLPRLHGTGQDSPWPDAAPNRTQPLKQSNALPAAIPSSTLQDTSNASTRSATNPTTSASKNMSFSPSPSSLPSYRSSTPSPSSSSPPSSSSSSSSSSLTAKLMIEVVFPEVPHHILHRQGLSHPSLLPWPTQGLPTRAPAPASSSQPAPSSTPGLDILWLVNGSFAPAAAALLEWQQPLQAVARHCKVELLLEHGSLLVAACPPDVEAVLGWLAAQPSVRWLSPRMQMVLHNRMAGAIVQSGSLLPGQDAANIAKHPLWQVGIDGSGQVIGTGDSGLDMNSCYFTDPAVNFRAGVTLDNTGLQVFSSSSHRKVLLYVGMQDMTDGYGHGTHTSGSLAGSVAGADSVNAPSAATGMAPNAKLAFMDLSRGSSSTVWTPGDLGQGYYSRSFAVGARIHSDSWGSDASVYDSMAASVDRFTWTNPTFLPVFAAGNYGDTTASGSTITSPATAKNALAVGAALNYMPNYVSRSSITSNIMQLNVPMVGANNSALVRTTLVVEAAFGGSWAGLKSQGPLPLAAASPADACSGLNAAVLTGKVVVAIRGNCYFSDKLKNAAAAGALGLIITSDSPEGYFYITPHSASDLTITSIPLGGVPLSVGRDLWYATSLGATSGATVTFSNRPAVTNAYDDLASFSSFGPTVDGRIKPDLVAPAVLTSAGINKGSGSDCTTTLMQGTSMACPVVAGSAALVRQYFTNGFYPTGAAVAANRVPAPSGALVKAVLMTGAAPLLGNVQPENPTAGGLPLEPPPSSRQGWGRVDLSGALPLVGSSRAWRLQVVDQANLTQGQQHRYCVQATGGGPLRITLAWHDFPGDPAAATALVNDLNLEVRAAGLAGLSLLGNGWVDNLNNVESVLMESVPQGNVAITVSAARVLARASPQPYSLVVLGRFSGTLQSPFNPVGAVSTTTGSCVINLAVIDANLSTAALTSSRDIVFFYSTQSGAAPPGGFECKLTDQTGRTSPKPLHDWQACSSPSQYSGVPDGRYVFQVRPAGEDVSDQRSVTVDSTPPITSVTSSLNLTPALGATAAVTSTDNITFAFSATDTSPVTYTCFLSVDSPVTPAAPYYRSLPAPTLPLGSRGSCQSPLSLFGLTYGNWSLVVQAMDAAGNTDRSPSVLSWQQRYNPSVVYTRFSSTPPPLTNNSRLSFQLYSFTGSASGPPSTAGQQVYEYQQWALTGSAASARPSSWQPLPASTPSLVLAASADGLWAVAARVQGTSGQQPDSAALATATVDTTPPLIVVTDAPSALQTSPIVTIRFASNPADDAISFACRWLSAPSSAPSPSSPDAGSTAFGPCNGPSITIASSPVTNGYWLFQVRGTDAAGNTSPPTSVAFRTDLDPPAITITAANATTQRAVVVSYQVQDGPTGTGIANISCSMIATNLVPTNSTTSWQPPSAEYQQPTGVLVTPCPNPAKYALSEGRFMFSIQAQDNAGLKSQRDWAVVVDMTPPLVKMSTPALAPGVAWPSQLTLNFDSRDLPDGASSGINFTECQISSASNRTAQPPPAAANQTLPPPANASAPPASVTSPPASVIVPAAGSPPSGVVVASAPGSPAVQAAGRLLLQSSPPAPRFANGPDIVFGTWQICSSPVTLQNLVSGSYVFKARPTDMAGNVGQPTDGFALLVDDTLALPSTSGPTGSPSGSGTGFSANKMIIAIVAAVGGLLVAAVVAAVIIFRRRMVGRAPLPAPPPYPPPSSQYPGGVYHNGGYPPAGITNPPAGPYFNPVAAHHHPGAQQQWEEEQRIKAAIQASIEEEKVRQALEASRLDLQRQNEDARLQAAIRASLAQHSHLHSGSPHSPGP